MKPHNLMRLGHAAAATIAKGPHDRHDWAEGWTRAARRSKPPRKWEEAALGSKQSEIHGSSGEDDESSGL